MVSVPHPVSDWNHKKPTFHRSQILFVFQKQIRCHSDFYDFWSKAQKIYSEKWSFNVPSQTFFVEKESLGLFFGCKKVSLSLEREWDRCHRSRKMGDTLIWNGGKCWFLSLPFSLSLSHLHTHTHSLSLSRSYLSIFGCMLLLFLSPLLFLFHSSPDGSSHSNLRTSDLSSSNFFSCHCLSNEQKNFSRFDISLSR